MKKNELEGIIYPKCKCFNQGYLQVSALHKIYFEEYGNPSGEPVLFIHGGPGAKSKGKYARFFNPEKYRIILHHQRGAGKSQPYASTTENTTDDLVEDIQKLRKHLGVNGKAHLMGGSWGSFLALVYAIRHPDLVTSLTLRGIFLAREKDMFDAYQRNAEKKRQEFVGVPDFYPEFWQEFVDAIPSDERSDMLTAYYKRINNIGGQYSIKEQENAIKHWCKWENATIKLETCSNKKLEKATSDIYKLSATAKLESHYFYNKCFVEDNYILKNISNIAHLPIIIVQARYDMVTPRTMADALIDALNTERKKLGLKKLTSRKPIGGHTMVDPKVAKALIKATDEQIGVIRKKLKKLAG